MKLDFFWTFFDFFWISSKIVQKWVKIGLFLARFGRFCVKKMCPWVQETQKYRDFGHFSGFARWRSKKNYFFLPTCPRMHPGAVLPKKKFGIDLHY